MKVAIMGTGAMACLFGSRMIQGGSEVWLVSGWKEHVEKLRAGGLTLSENGQQDVLVRPNVTTRPEDVLAGGSAFPDLVMISSKGYQTKSTVQNALGIIGPQTSVLTLQNGIGNAEVIAESVPAGRIYFGAASVAADLVALGHIRDTTNRNRSPLISIIPYSRVMDETCARLGGLFTSMGYDTDASVAAEKYVWKKLCVNSCANAIAGLSQLENCVFSNDPDGFSLISRVCAEVCAVACAKGIPLDYEDTRAYIHFTLYNQHHHVSMCQDVHNKRQTEIDFINGAVVREAKKLNIPVPVNETLTHLIRLISKHYGDQWV